MICRPTLPSLLLLLFTSALFAQQQPLVVPLTVRQDSLTNTFFYIQPGLQSLPAKLPEGAIESYSIARYLDLTSCHMKLPIYMGIRPNGSRVIAFDKNMNYDFRDEELIEFTDTVNSVLQGNFKTAYIKLNDSLTIAFDYTIIKPRSLTIHLSRAYNPVENNLFLSVRPHEYRTGSLQLNNGSGVFVLITKTVWCFDKQTTYLVQLDKGPGDAAFYEQLKRAHRYTEGDKLLVDQKPYIFKRVAPDGSHIILEPVPDENVLGNAVGFRSLDVKTTSIKNDPVNVASYKGSYVLLDFWGTWCGPCRQIVPGLKLLHEKYPKLKMIGIAYDNKVTPVKEYVQKENIGWDQVFDERSAANMGYSISEAFQVDQFPSFIVIDPSGKIVYRDMGVDGFDRLQAFIGELTL